MHATPDQPTQEFPVIVAEFDEPEVEDEEDEMDDEEDLDEELGIADPDPENDDLDEDYEPGAV